MLMYTHSSAPLLGTPQPITWQQLNAFRQIDQRYRTFSAPRAGFMSNYIFHEPDHQIAISAVLKVAEPRWLYGVI